MSVQIAGTSEIPAALPIETESDAREKMLREAEMNNAAPGNVATVIDDDELDELVEIPKTSKKKIFFAFVCFCLGFVLLVLLMSWFFGLGAFAAAKPQAVDRTKQTNSSNPAPVTEEEKLRMALDMVAEKNPTGQTSENSDVSQPSPANSSVDLPPAKAADLNEPMVVPDPLSETGRNQANSPMTVAKVERISRSDPAVKNADQSSVNNEKNSNSRIQPINENNQAPVGRSLFFGISQTEKPEIKPISQNNKPTVPINENVKITTQTTPPIPFGTLLPVRLIGAVYSLRASGGLVRMELTRQVSGKNYSYPAGTVLVGNLRGSEYKRVFISVVGLIDPGSGGLVKLTGEVMGNDGASGITGRLRQVKSTWSRIFGGLRDVSAVALGAIGSRRSGGTVVISDSTNKATGVLSDELSGVIGNAKNPDEFVEVAAGTTAFLLVTDLPDEIKPINFSGPDKQTSTGLTERELADLLSEGNQEKIRAALPRMTPQFRLLAEKYLAIEDK